jgi:hypothetical protein
VVERELVVAEGEHQQPAGAPDPAPDMGEDVERRLVGPVAVLEHADPERLEQRRAVADAEVAQRPERLRDREVVARAPQNFAALGEAPDERGLADPGLAGHHDDAAAGGGGLDELRQRVVSFEQPHGANLTSTALGKGGEGSYGASNPGLVGQETTRTGSIAENASCRSSSPSMPRR